ncbi:hypothetical protein Bca52824_011442 [Brassica carinata]|uniref:Uncharacterized protein n=1 Tax=Brassica carinata TaxID=52824 RepID=A0A8X7WFD3_BRACI|nr:hypothetical protein Bca52824_011442 [Brassica carinata]
MENASYEREEIESSSRIRISRRKPWLFEFLELWGSKLRVVKGFDETRRETSLGLKDGFFFGDGRRRRRRKRGTEKRVLVVDSLFSRREWREK